MQKTALQSLIVTGSLAIGVHEVKRRTYSRIKNQVEVSDLGLLGHGFLLQFRDSVEFPSSLQLWPPYFGTGLSQVRCQSSAPLPHETLHLPLKVQLL